MSFLSASNPYLSTCCLLASLCMACGGSAKKTESNVSTVKAEPKVEVTQESGVVFSIEPGDAQVFVGGELLGTATDVNSEGFLPLDAGLHQIMIRHVDYQTYRVEVTIGDQVERLEIKLQER